MKFSVVITTIYLPKILQDLAVNLDKYSRKNEVEVIVIGDVKTPDETADYVAKFANQGFNFEYWNLEAQKKWLERYPDLDEMVPTHSDNRRNIGHLLAYERGRECIIALDDDNFPTDDDYFSGHDIVGKTMHLPTVRSNSGWYNVCDMLDIEGGQKIYPRGYPYKLRHAQTPELEYFQSEGRIVVNAGLWLGDPDIDAVTRLNESVNVVGIKERFLSLDPSTNCPYNTQNTAFHRDIVPSYYYVMMGHDLGGLRIDRYGDIWSSYFSRKVIDTMGDRVSFGTPLTMHKRHDHDLMKDLGQEYWGMVITNKLVDVLGSIELKGDSYLECYKHLSYALQNTSREEGVFSAEVQTYLAKICQNMRIWTDICSDL